MYIYMHIYACSSYSAQTGQHEACMCICCLYMLGHCNYNVHVHACTGNLLEVTKQKTCMIELYMCSNIKLVSSTV